MDELQKLYRELSDRGYYTKSFDEFSEQLEDDSYKQKVYDVVSKDGLYTKDYDSFSSKYYAEDVKKKDDTDSTSLEVSSDSSESDGITLLDVGKTLAFGIAGREAFLDADYQNAIDQGIAQGYTPTQVSARLFNDNVKTREDAQALVDASEKMEEIGPSENYKNFENRIQELVKDGNDEWSSTFLSLGENPEVATETVLQSFVSMGAAIKEDPVEMLKYIGGGAALGFGKGFATGGPKKALAGALFGGLQGGRYGINYILEKNLSAIEFIKDELDGKTFNADNVLEVINDKEKYDRIVSRSVRRGATIASVETILGRVSSGIKPVAGKVVTEIASGSASEALGRVAAEQEMSPQDIILEGVGGLVGVGSAIVEGKARTYKINGENTTKEKAQVVVDNLDSEELKDVKIQTNDKEFAESVREKKKQKAPEKKPEVQEDVEEEKTYSLPENPKEAKEDFEIIDNRNGKAGLEVEEDGSGNWVLRNKKTDRTLNTKTKKQAQQELKDLDWDYGEGDVIQQEAPAQETQQQAEQEQIQDVDDSEQQQSEPQKKTFFERYKALGKTLSTLKQKVGLDPKRGNKVIRDEQERTKGNVSAESYIALNTLKKINKLIGKDQNGETVANKVLRGEEITEEESTKYTNLILETQQARSNIDNLSQQLIDLGVLPKESAENVADNLGTYITRAYEAFENPNFIPTTAARTQAKEFLLANPEYIQEAAEAIAEEEGMSLEKALDEQADKYLDDLLEKQSGDTFLSREYKLKKGILKRRKDVPKALRGFLGEIESGTEGYYITHLKLSNLLNTARYQKAMLDKGLGKFIFERKNRPQGTVQIKGSAYSILDGYFASQETIDSIIPKQQQNNYKFLVNFFLDLNGLTKGWLTVYNPASYLRNYISTMVMLGVRGDLNSLSGVIQAHKDYRKFWLSQVDVNQKIVEYKKAGIIGQNVEAGTVESILNDRSKDPNTALEAAFNGKGKRSITARSLIREFYKIPYLGKGTKGIADFLQSTFQAGDDVGKIIAYEKRKKFYADALFDKPVDQLSESQLSEVKEKASNEIKDQYNNYDRVPKSIKLLGKTPLVGSFVQFPAEMIRNSVNIYLSAIDNINSGNPKLKADGIKRIATFTTAQAALAVGSTILGETILKSFDLGSDEREQEIKDLRNVVAPWSKNNKINVVSKSKNKLSYMDISANNPYAFVSKMIQQGIDKDNALDVVVGAAVEFFTPFVQEEVLFKAAREASSGETGSGRRIWYKQDNLAEKGGAAVMHVAEAAMPGYVKTIQRLTDKDKSVSNELKSLTGFRTTDVKLDTSLYFKMKDLYETSEDIKSKYRAKRREDESTSVESFQEEYEAEFKKAHEIYMSHIRLGLEPKLAFSQLKKMMGKNQKFTNAERGSIITGKKPPLLK